jgi:hypothetical protein
MWAEHIPSLADEFTVYTVDMQGNVEGRAQGVIAFRKSVGDRRLEAACARAIAVGDPSYCTVKGILAAGTELDGAIG